MGRQGARGQRRGLEEGGVLSPAMPHLDARPWPGLAQGAPRESLLRGRIQEDNLPFGSPG